MIPHIQVGYNGRQFKPLWYSGRGSLKVKPRFHSRLQRAAIKKEAKGGSKLDTVKPGIIKKQMVLGLHVYTTSLNCWDIKHTHTGTLTITHISMTQTRELGNVKRKSRMLFSVNGTSGPVVKRTNMSSFFFPLPQIRHSLEMLQSSVMVTGRRCKLTLSCRTAMRACWFIYLPSGHAVLPVVWHDARLCARLCASADAYSCQIVVCVCIPMHALKLQRFSAVAWLQTHPHLASPLTS